MSSRFSIEQNIITQGMALPFERRAVISRPANLYPLSHSFNEKNLIFTFLNTRDGTYAYILYALESGRPKQTRVGNLDTNEVSIPTRQNGAR
jgi:hypothetical protein